MTAEDDTTLPRGVVAIDPHRVEVHFDGACEPPKGGGVATWGYVVRGAGLYHEDSGLAVRPYSPHATNNVAEYVAAIRALEWLGAQGFAGEVLAMGDSQLVVRQMQGSYRVRAEHLRAYHEHLSRLAAGFRRVEFQWVPREQNRRADELSKEALEAAGAAATRHRPDLPVEVPEEESAPDESGPDAPGADQFHRTV